MSWNYQSEERESLTKASASALSSKTFLVILLGYCTSVKAFQLANVLSVFVDGGHIHHQVCLQSESAVLSGDPT